MTGQKRLAIAAMVWTFRHNVARLMIHGGLRVMPPGRVRRELTELLWTWSLGVYTEVAVKHRPVQKDKKSVAELVLFGSGLLSAALAVGSILTLVFFQGPANDWREPIWFFFVSIGSFTLHQFVKRRRT